MRAVIYARVSSDDQVQGSSLDTQVQACLEHCENKGYSVLAEFREDYTGASYTRPELDKVFELADKGAFDVLVVFSVDRFARDLTAHMVLLKEFEAAGIQVDFTVGQFDRTPEGKLMEQVQAVISEYERAQIQRRTERGKRERVKRGYVMPGRTPPYGYRYESGEREGYYRIEETEAEIVRQIYDWYTEDKIGSIKIARRLTAESVPTKWDIQGHKKKKRRRGVWYHTSVMSILSNSVYTGKYYYGIKTDNPIMVEIEPIITEKQFEKAQQQRRINVDHSPRNTRYEYLLRRRLRCSGCGYLMTGTTTKGKTLSQQYRCPGRLDYHSNDGKRPTCSGTLDVRTIDAVVWQFFKNELRSVERLKQRIEAHRRIKTKSQEQLQSEHDELQARLVELDEQQEEYIKLIGAKHIQRSVFDKVMTDNHRERVNVQRRISEIHIEPVQPLDQVDIAQEYILEIRGANFEKKRKFIDKLDVRVQYIAPDQLEVSYTLAGLRLVELLTV